MARVQIDTDLYERARQAAEKADYTSVDELIAQAIERELKRLGVENAERNVSDQLRGLGYLE